MNGETASRTNVEIRPARADEMTDVDRIIGYAFANNDEPKEPPEPNPLQPGQTLCGFDGQQMIATAGSFTFKMRFNGQAVDADGVTIVATDPGYRRRGIVRELITGLLQRAHANNVPVAILWASMGAIYQRFGYGLATAASSYDIEPRHVRFQYGERAGGHVRLLKAADALPLLQGVYRQFSAAGTGMLHRGTQFWNLMLQRQNNRHSYVAVYFDQDDTPTGYCLYRTHWQDLNVPEPTHVIDVFDFSWLDIDAYRGIWEYLAGHDLAVRIRMEFVPEDDPAPVMLLEPRMLHRKTWDGIWMRIVDAEQTLLARGYDTSGEATIRVVDDELCPWNEGRFRLACDGGKTEVHRLPDRGNADIVTNPNALASLVSGYASASDLARMGRLSLGDRRLAPALDNLFATRRRPTCPNMF